MKKLNQNQSRRFDLHRRDLEIEKFRIETQRLTSSLDMDAWPVEPRSRKNANYQGSDGGLTRCPQISSEQKSARMVGMGFRYWYHGIKSLDTRFYEVCSKRFIHYFGLKHGLVLSTKLAHWVEAIDASKKRSLAVFGIDQMGFSYDEVIAISMIAALQHAECPAMKACLFALIEGPDIDHPHHAAQDFAEGLMDAGHILPTEYITLPLAAMQSQQSSCSH